MTLCDILGNKLPRGVENDLVQYFKLFPQVSSDFVFLLTMQSLFDWLTSSTCLPLKVGV